MRRETVSLVAMVVVVIGILALLVTLRHMAKHGPTAVSMLFLLVLGAAVMFGIVLLAGDVNTALPVRK
jgi:hypothetical protein